MGTMQAPLTGVNVRMYRQGHGDCFLLAFPRQEGGDPVYVLIDCGYKPGSQDFLHGKSIGDTVNHIAEATGSHLDLVIITHEHQDHVNGFWKEQEPYFKNFKIEAAWLAWTEDPNDSLANQLRKQHKDQLLGLVAARHHLALAVGSSDLAIQRMDSLLSLEFGGESDAFNLQAMSAAAADPAKSLNKQAMKYIKDKVFESSGVQGVQFLSPGGKPRPVSGSTGVRAYVMGPPRSSDLLLDENPQGSEVFPALGSGCQNLSFSAAVQPEPEAHRGLFDNQYRLPFELALKEKFFRDYYGEEKALTEDKNNIEAPKNPSWRRIDHDWLYSAENLALKLNTGLNNTSLVLAFELPATKKILLFTGDAQRGNWISWKDATWTDGEQTITARELLGRTVLYKVGHHGSHNATLDGRVEDDYPNLSWMGKGSFAGEFTAMIPAVNQWALNKNCPPWQHPLPSIKAELLQKAQGRVLQMDEAELKKPESEPLVVWEEFKNRLTVDELYIEYALLDT